MLLYTQKRPPTAFFSKQPTGVNYTKTRATTSFSGTNGSDQSQESGEFSALSPSTKKLSSGTVQLLLSDPGLLIFEAIPIDHGCHIPELFEHLAHIAPVRKSHIPVNLCQGQLGVQQEIGGPKDPFFVDGVLDTDPGLFFEEP